MNICHSNVYIHMHGSVFMGPLLHTALSKPNKQEKQIQ